MAKENDNEEQDSSRTVQKYGMAHHEGSRCVLKPPPPPAPPVPVRTAER